MTDTERQAATDITARAAASLILALTAQGIPLHLVLIGLHAEAVIQTTAHFGGQIASDMCDRAASRVRALPSAAEWCAMDSAATHAGGVA